MLFLVLKHCCQMLLGEDVFMLSTGFSLRKAPTVLGSIGGCGCLLLLMFDTKNYDVHLPKTALALAYNLAL